MAINQKPPRLATAAALKIVRLAGSNCSWNSPSCASLQDLLPPERGKPEFDGYGGEDTMTVVPSTSPAVTPLAFDYGDLDQELVERI